MCVRWPAQRSLLIPALAYNTCAFTYICPPPTHYLYISIISRLGESVCTLPHAPHAGHGPVYVPTPLPPLTTEYRRAELVRYGPAKSLQPGFASSSRLGAASSEQPGSDQGFSANLHRIGRHRRPWPTTTSLPAPQKAYVASISSQRTRSTTQPSSQARHQLQRCLQRCRSVCDRQSEAAGPVAVGSYAATKLRRKKCCFT